MFSEEHLTVEECSLVTLCVSLMLTKWWFFFSFLYRIKFKLVLFKNKTKTSLKTIFFTASISAHHWLLVWLQLYSSSFWNDHRAAEENVLQHPHQAWDSGQVSSGWGQEVAAQRVLGLSWRAQESLLSAPGGLCQGSLVAQRAQAALQPACQPCGMGWTRRSCRSAATAAHSLG